MWFSCWGERCQKIFSRLIAIIKIFPTWKRSWQLYLVSWNDTWAPFERLYRYSFHISQLRPIHNTNTRQASLIFFWNFQIYFEMVVMSGRGHGSNQVPTPSAPWHPIISMVHSVKSTLACWPLLSMLSPFSLLWALERKQGVKQLTHTRDYIFLHLMSVL